jgi:hypothetical protein
MRRILGLILTVIVVLVLFKVVFAAMKLGFLIVLLLLVLWGGNALLGRRK